MTDSNPMVDTPDDYEEPFNALGVSNPLPHIKALKYPERDALTEAQIVASRISEAISDVYMWMHQFGYTLNDLKDVPPYEVVMAMKHNQALDQPTLNNYFDEGNDEQD